MAKAPQQQKVSFRERLKQIRMVFAFTAKRDKAFVPLVIVAALVPLVAVAVVIALGFGWVWLPAGIIAALLAVMIVLNIRSNKAMMREAEGKPGAAAMILEGMRGDWRVQPVVQVTTAEDCVHRVIGRAGVILVGEGHPGRVKGLLGQEKKRLSKVVGSTPIQDFIVGNDEGQVPIGKLRVTLMKLPRTLTAGQVSALHTRLSALSARPTIPQGAIPKNMRPKGAFRAMRGR